MSQLKKNNRYVHFTEEDRERIIQHEVKINAVSLSLVNLNTDMKAGFTAIFNKLDASVLYCEGNRKECKTVIDEKIGKFFTKKVLMPVLGLIIVSLISMGVYSGKMSNMVNLNTYKIYEMEGRNNGKEIITNSSPT